eukprot:NODE_383_length_8356_cov_0.477898.p7 type:complete len:118 gc:universal NODE_383_length_8356_cov_0.477898:2785-2432(-)
MGDLRNKVPLNSLNEMSNVLRELGNKVSVKSSFILLLDILKFVICKFKIGVCPVKLFCAISRNFKNCPNAGMGPFNLFLFALKIVNEGVKIGRPPVNRFLFAENETREFIVGIAPDK